ncbi:hypothetical protein GCK32_010084 [Trichostrongylus colubriformis]|uniref:Uncharacterized protein n=1 Tax=Trichostrongylus colubriformis TaxID=6319 RepID=A0AAN8F305_TRICO
MSVEDGWVSERLIDLNIAAPFQPDPCVKITPYEAEEMLKDRIRREVARMIASDSPDLERSEYRVRNPKKSGTCVRCGCETTAGKELRRRRGDPYSSLPEAVSPSKSSDGDHSEKSTSDVDYHRAGSVTEQLMSVARKMHAKNEQQGNDLSDAQERNWLWTPQPDRATRSSQESNESQMTRPSLSSPNLPLASETAPKSGNFARSVGGDGCEGDDEKSDACSTGEIKKLSKKIDHCSPENEPISRIRPWKLEDDEGLSTSAKAPNAESG